MRRPPSPCGSSGVNRAIRAQTCQSRPPHAGHRVRAVIGPPVSMVRHSGSGPAQRNHISSSIVSQHRPCGVNRAPGARAMGDGQAFSTHETVGDCPDRLPAWRTRRPTTLRTRAPNTRERGRGDWAHTDRQGHPANVRLDCRHGARSGLSSCCFHRRSVHAPPVRPAGAACVPCRAVRVGRGLAQARAEGQRVGTTEGGSGRACRPSTLLSPLVRRCVR